MQQSDSFPCLLRAARDWRSTDGYTDGGRLSFTPSMAPDQAMDTRQSVGDVGGNDLPDPLQQISHKLLKGNMVATNAASI
jgi:hypothetical protein